MDQQFEIGLRIAAAGLVPILEPEIDIYSPDKAESEQIMKDEIKTSGSASGGYQADV